MNNVLRNPDKTFDYARLYATSVASIIAWGHRAADFDSFWSKDVYKLIDMVGVARGLLYQALTSS